MNEKGLLEIISVFEFSKSRDNIKIGRNGSLRIIGICSFMNRSSYNPTFGTFFMRFFR